VPRLVRAVREQLLARQQQSPRIRLRLTLGFLAVLALVSCAGREPRPWLVPLLALVPLAQELPRALWAFHRGYAATVVVDVGGGRTDIAGPPPSPRFALGLALLGCAVGVVGAFTATRSLAGFLEGVSLRNPVAFGGAAVVLTLVALAAAFVPMRRALRLNPADALRAD